MTITSAKRAGVGVVEMIAFAPGSQVQLDESRKQMAMLLAEEQSRVNRNGTRRTKVQSLGKQLHTYAHHLVLPFFEETTVPTVEYSRKKLISLIYIVLRCAK